MKSLQLLITLAIVATSTPAATAQYFQQQGIYVLQKSEHAHGLRYRKQIEFPADYSKENMDSIVTRLAPILYQCNANTIKIIEAKVRTREYNKRHTKFTLVDKNVVTAELAYADRVDQLQPILLSEYIDSLSLSLIEDPLNEALFVIYPSSVLADEEEFPAITFDYFGKHGCTINGLTVCSYVVKKHTPFIFNLYRQNEFTVYPKAGKVYFMEYLPTPQGNLFLVDFLTGYRSCKEIQALNDELHMMRK